MRTTDAFTSFRARLVWYLLFIFIGSILRLWLISDNNVLFWYDQARDAIVARQIISDRDLKTQGPSASGTDDTINHGVLNYYVIAPLYEIADGNPQFVSGALGIISMLALIPLGELAWQIFRSGGEKFKKIEHPETYHFALFELGQGIPDHLSKIFEESQNAISTLVEETTFGSMRVQERFGHGSLE